jgi:hypothetical protein
MVSRWLNSKPYRAGHFAKASNLKHSMATSNNTPTEFSTNSLAVKAAELSHVLAPFISKSQSISICTGEENDYFLRLIVDLAELIEGIQSTFEQDGKGNHALVDLHYFSGRNDWFITKKNVDGGVDQAFSYVILHGDDQNAKLGYILIRELTRLGVELDFHFTPSTLATVKAERERRAA